MLHIGKDRGVFLQTAGFSYPELLSHNTTIFACMATKNCTLIAIVFVMW